MQARIPVLVLAALALAPLASALVPAPRIAEVYRNGVYLERFDNGEVTCKNNGFATVTLHESGAAFLTLESPTCVNFAGPFQAVGSFEEGWRLEYALSTDADTHRATLSAHPTLPSFAFESYTFEPATGADTVVRAVGTLRAVLGPVG